MQITLPKQLLTSLLALLLPFTASAIPQKLTPDEIHSTTIVAIAQSLDQGHYKDITINDQLSGSVFDQYLKDIDPTRSYFYQQDIDNFNKYKRLLDDNIKSGELDPAFVIFNKLQLRIEERLDYIINLLESDKKFDFTVDEVLEADREEAPWVKNHSEMNELWRLRLKSAMLNLILADKTAEEAREVLLKRYRNQLKRAMQVNNEDVFQTFANAFTKQYDPHTAYFSPRKSENFKINMSLSLEGIGAVLKIENEYVQIVRIVPASPAEKTGQLKASDLIIGVGQGEEGEIEDVVGWRLDDVVQLIRGPKGTTVRLQVKPSEGSDIPPKIVKIVRNKIKLEDQSAQKKILEFEHLGRQFKIGVIEIPQFYIDFAALQRGDKDYKSTSRDVEKLIKELKEEKVEGIIVDLRNNGGGSLREANETVGLFIKHGPTVQVKNSTGRIDVLYDQDPKEVYQGAVAVLVNRLSASASEIFAGAMQDYKRGIVIGGQTFGKGTVQTLLPLEHGQLKLTHAKFYRVSGESTQNNGVIPDINFPTLYDPTLVGESTYDKALVWDTVKARPHGNYGQIAPFLKQLKLRHDKRSTDDPDFLYMRDQVQRQQEKKDERNIIKLQKSALEQQRNEAEQWMVDAENRRRTLKKQPAIDKLSDLDEELEKDKLGRPVNPEAEAMLTETGRILVDMMLFRMKYSSVKK